MEVLLRQTSPVTALANSPWSRSSTRPARTRSKPTSPGEEMKMRKLRDGMTSPSDLDLVTF
jgi:hypothetical protein